MSSAAETSHGRGGAGNITADDTEYVDGEVVRLGNAGSHGDGAFSAGRGGAGNIADVGTAPTQRRDQEIVPAAAVRTSSEDQDFHTGRGGVGNEHTSLDRDPRTAPKAGANSAESLSLADKLKNKLFAIFKK
ncbi:hypothetical protein HRG_011543 [Hirsutella rhossiliensis]|uniref:Uncharacterized protein n=1 Tax=Hirsutella rhossiliensis TaxID=111463 RepID=A0A9P8SDV2_9HYPO|nr:uncharacterized protein HRG_11543 [Hirsutella rhossiliensis]KAH0957396.1 hypothetical protein HRG_11543 [Hirsutella rhossiliensis]